MQVTDYSYYLNSSSAFRKSPCFGRNVSKLGRQIDKVLSQNGKVNNDVDRLKFMLEDYFINSCSNDKNLIGEGFHGRVFSIDDKYVFKCKNGINPNIKNGKCSIMSGMSPLTGLKTYFGEILMHLGGIKILRNVSSDGKHVPVGIPRFMLGKYSKDELEYYYSNIYLPRFANLPQRSFDNLAHDFAYLNSKSKPYYGLQFDTNNPNNIVLAGTSTLRIVDDIEEVLEKNPNRVCALLDMFLKKANVSMLAPKTNENRALRFELFKKIILSGEKYELPLTSDLDYDNNVWNMVCDFGQTGEEVLCNLYKLRDDIKSPRERLKLVNNFLESMKVSVDK